MKLRNRLQALWTGDRLLALLFFLVLIFYGVSATQLRSGLMSDIVGPKSFPLLLTGFGLFLVAIFLYQQLRNGDRAGSEGRRMKGELWDLIPLFMLVIYVLALKPVGYLLSTFVYTTLTLRFLGQPTWRASISFGLALTALTFSLFFYVFEVRLPPGSIFPRYF